MPGLAGFGDLLARLALLPIRTRVLAVAAVTLSATGAAIVGFGELLDPEGSTLAGRLGRYPCAVGLTTLLSLTAVLVVMAMLERPRGIGRPSLRAYGAQLFQRLRETWRLTRHSNPPAVRRPSKEQRHV